VGCGFSRRGALGNRRGSFLYPADGRDATRMPRRWIPISWIPISADGAIRPRTLPRRRLPAGNPGGGGSGEASFDVSPPRPLPAVLRTCVGAGTVQTFGALF